jgi:hypothetical protein
MPSRPLDSSDEKKIAEWYKDGLTIEQIMKRMRLRGSRVGQDRVREVLTKHDVQIIRDRRFM